MPAGNPNWKKKPTDLEALADTLQEILDRKTNRKIDFFVPYPKQQAFMDASVGHRERLFMAGNQLGKTETGAAEMAYHLTGEYPEDWMGRRWTRPIRAWAAGETGLLVRDVQQKKLCGEPGVVDAQGTGLIPKEALLNWTLGRGVTDGYDTIQVKHKSGGTSILKFKSYEQGRTKFQGETLDIIWCDEEPPEEIYSECLTRITATKGMIYVTFTPLKGMSNVVRRYLNEPSPDRTVVTMTIDDALHISPEDRAVIIAGYPAHEREARAKGIPMLGSGRIFTTPEDSLAEPDLTYIPPHWTKLWGIDFGIGHPFAAVLSAWDRDNDVVHLLHGIRMTDGLPIMHSQAMKPIGAAVPVAWPQDGTAREKGSGETVAGQYRKTGLMMLGTHATWADGGVSTEAGILEMQQRMSTGRLKVAASMAQWFEEYRLYHRKDGVIVKMQDDLLSATRIAIMMLRYGRAVQLGNKIASRRNGGVADGVDFDVFA